MQTGTTINDLSFIQAGKWAPDRSGDYGANNWRGGEYAEELLEMINRTENPTLFGGVVRAMTTAAVFEGVEIGFCSKIGVYVWVNQRS